MKKTLVFIFFIVLSGCSNSFDDRANFFWNYDKGIENAKLLKRPTLLIFDSWSNPISSSIRLLEDREIQKETNHYVIILLMVDDRTKYDGFLTLGKKNTIIQKMYGVNNTPMYLLLNANQKLISKPKGYMKKNEFIKFLNQ